MDKAGNRYGTRHWRNRSGYIARSLGNTELGKWRAAVLVDDKERQLEQMAEKVIGKAERLTLAPPIFELYAALLSMSLAILMFLFPELLAGKGILYCMMTDIMPQGGWALGFFFGGVTSAIGMLMNSTWMRVWALVGMATLYGALTLIYSTMLPNFGFTLMLWITIFTIASIPLTKYTGIWNKTKGER